MTSGILRARADWVGALEAAYAPAKDDVTWARGVVESARRIFRSEERISLQVVEHDPDCVTMHMAANAATEPDLEVTASQLAIREFPLGAAGFRTFFYPPAMVLTQSELDPLLTPDHRAYMDAFRRSIGNADLVGIVVHPLPGMCLVLSSGLDRRTAPSRHERSALSLLGLHLESAYRLRRRPEVVKGVLTLKGATTRRTADRSVDDALAHHARRIEHSFTRKGRSDPDAALELWTALVLGRYSLVSRTDGGARRYLVLENTPQAQAMRALTPRECDVLAMSARGMSTKLVAYGLGLSPSTVSSALSRAASKLGLSTRLELLRLAATLAHDPRSAALPATLTGAESEVLELLREGMSNEQIARMRSRSVRTVANQVASLLRKTNSATRRALAVDASVAPVLDEPP